MCVLKNKAGRDLKRLENTRRRPQGTFFHRLLLLLCLGLALRQACACLAKYRSGQLTFGQYSVPLAEEGGDMPSLSVGSVLKISPLGAIEEEGGGGGGGGGEHQQPYDAAVLRKLAGVKVEDYVVRGRWTPGERLAKNMTAEELFESVTEPNLRSGCENGWCNFVFWHSEWIRGGHWALELLGATCRTVVSSLQVKYGYHRTTDRALKTVLKVGTAGRYAELQVKLLFIKIEPQLIYKSQTATFASSTVLLTTQNFWHCAHLWNLWAVFWGWYWPWHWPHFRRSGFGSGSFYLTVTVTACFVALLVKKWSCWTNVDEYVAWHWLLPMLLFEPHKYLFQVKVKCQGTTISWPVLCI